MALLLTAIPLSRTGAQPSFSILSRNAAAVGSIDPDLHVGSSRIMGTIEGSGDAWGFHFDGSLEAVRDRDGWRMKSGLRNLRIDAYGERFETRIGWQTPDVGRIADGVVSETFSRLDLRDFTLPEREDLIIGTPMVRTTWFAGADYLDLIATPVPFPTRIPPEGSHWDLLKESPLPVRRTSRPPAWSADQTQAVFRLALRSPETLNMDLVAGRWSGSMPVFGLEVTGLTTPQGVPAAKLEIVETFPAEWLAGISAEWIAGGSWLLSHEHLFILNRRSLATPVEAELLRTAFDNPQAMQMLLAGIQARGDLYLSPSPASSHQITLSRSSGRWSMSTGIRLDMVHGDGERRLQRSRFFTADASFAGRWMRDRLLLDIDATWHPSPFDVWIHPSLAWQGSDRRSARIGAQLFGGRDPDDPLYPHLSFHRFRNDGFIYLRYTRHII